MARKTFAELKASIHSTSSVPLSTEELKLIETNRTFEKSIKDITVEDLKGMKKLHVLNFIRSVLSEIGTKYPINNEKSRCDIDSDLVFSKGLSFNMSGYDTGAAKYHITDTKLCHITNTNILHRFAYLGIYDYTDFLVLDFYKGCPRLYFKYFGCNDYYFDEDEMNGWTTSEIIYRIFEFTLLSENGRRRRG